MLCYLLRHFTDTIVSFLLFHSTPLDYTFSAPGDDWPSSFDAVPQSTRDSSKAPQRINPLRRAAKWAFGSRKNQAQ